MNELNQLLEQSLTDQLLSLTLSKPVDKNGIQKLRMRPLMHRGELVFQMEEFTKTQVFHKNLTAEEACSYLLKQIPERFLQGQVETAAQIGTILANRKGTITVKKKKKQASAPAKISLDHNRKKNYILEEGIPVPFLIDLGVMTADGHIVHSHYDKFRQINRFLEFIEDILPSLPKDRQLRILDFGCGKSYLTFAMYYYLHELKGYDIRVTGLDLKEDVIRRCSQLAEKYGYDNLEFLCGDVAFYDACDQIDMMVTLHACDTATDYALAKAVHWGAKVILSVPCCQHELNKQIKSELLSPVLDYGILKERISALLTDGLRASLLEEQGYRTQILEFIDMEHTPKNLLIRAVRSGTKKPRSPETDRLMQELGVSLTLPKLIE
ncbi:MAG: SAM-dependent methyltransferase [Lachnospiraceae bacterium]|nr:SAM-dependent methyltransferase [Lachnospiraceae bacterium]